MINIAVLKSNDINLNNITYDELNNGALEKILRDNITFNNIRTVEDDMLIDIITNISPNVSERIVTNKCYEGTSNNIYALYAMNDKNPKNNLGRLVSIGHEEFNGNCVLINTNIISAMEMKNCDITYDDIFNMFKSFINHKAIMIEPDDDIENIKIIMYNNHPIENSNFTNDNCKSYDIDFGDNSLCVFMSNDVDVKTHKLNKLATILCKKYRIYGTVVVSLYSRMPHIKMIDLDKELFHNILKVKSNSREHPGINDENTNFHKSVEYMAGEKNIIYNIPDDILCGPIMNMVDCQKNDL
jgi:hypothetical protein